MEVGAQSRAIIELLERDRAHPAAISLPATSQFRNNSSISAGLGAILHSDRATLYMAYAQMAAIFEPLSSARQQFLTRQQEDTEKPLAFSSALLALARAAYTSMDAAARDLLVLERLIFLARELGVALSVADEADVSSLKVAQGIQAHLSLRQPPGVVRGP
ncbi:unnamed protein product [Lampetra fluviatilis]